MYKRFPLSLRIFLVMILVIISTVFAMGIITFYQYNKMTEDYGAKRLEEKEQIVVDIFDYHLSKKNVISNEVKEVIGNKIFEVADINNVDINFYSLDGIYLLGNKPNEIKAEFVPKEILKELSVNNNRIAKVYKSEETGSKYTTVYRYIYNNDYQPIAIIHLPYLYGDSFLKEDFYTLIYRYMAIMFIILVISGLFSWFFSKSLTQKIKKIAHRLSDTEALTYNRPILYNYIDEISPLVKSYNLMLIKFREQTDLLIQTEKDVAWQEMARQVAHEIKNPLTPMMLEIQSFQMKFNPNDPEIKNKLNNLLRSLIQQINTISSIAEAFSDFAKMPVRQDQEVNVIEIIKNSIEIFPSQYITLEYTNDNIMLNMDPNSLNRVITNLVKNGIQAVPDNRVPEIIIKVTEGHKVVIFSVQDNGLGIPDEILPKIFTPQFSTKTSGSGLGLAITKKLIEEYKGSIAFFSEENNGSIFKFEIPKNV